MASHSGSKEEFIFFSFQTKSHEKEKLGQKPRKNKEKERAKNQAVTNLTPLKKSRPRYLVSQGTSMNILTKGNHFQLGYPFSFVVVPTKFLSGWPRVVCFTVSTF